jgi:hypothetical protein
MSPCTPHRTRSRNVYMALCSLCPVPSIAPICDPPRRFPRHILGPKVPNCSLPACCFSRRCTATNRQKSLLQLPHSAASCQKLLLCLLQGLTCSGLLVPLVWVLGTGRSSSRRFLNGHFALQQLPELSATCTLSYTAAIHFHVYFILFEEITV